MRRLLNESQSEYQKLYDICVQECEKSAKSNELIKKEKKLREEREQQILEMGEEQLMLRNQIKHLDEEMNKLREDSDSSYIKNTVIEQQKIIEKIREEFQNEKSVLQEKNFDLEEMIISNKDVIEDL